MVKQKKPDRPPTAEELRRVMSALGKRTSPKKAAAARRNGRKGGRPKHPER